MQISCDTKLKLNSKKLENEEKESLHTNKIFLTNKSIQHVLRHI